MTRLLEKAFDEASKLPANQQDELARRLLDDIRFDRLWDESFARSQDKLAGLAGEALEEHAKGLTEPLDAERE